MRRIKFIPAISIIILCSIIVIAVVVLITLQMGVSPESEEDLFSSAVNECKRKYPQKDYSDCVRGESDSGYTVTYIYPDTFDLSGFEQGGRIPEEVKGVGIGYYFNSETACVTIWAINFAGEWELTDQEIFCDHIMTYSLHYNYGLLEWTGNDGL